MSATVSVIVTVFNSGEYLDKCLESLSDQNLKGIEIVIVNDCSADSRDEEIARRYLKKNSSFKYVKNDQNLGTGWSREIGVGYATGEYIGFLDSDDYVERYAYDMMYSEATKNDADIVVSDFRCIDNRSLGVRDNQAPQELNVEILSGRDLFNSQILRINRPYYLRVDWWNKIYRKSLFVDNNVSFPRVVRNEGSMSMVMSLLSKKCVIVDHPVFYTTARPASVCRSFRERNIKDTIESAKHFKVWMLKLGVFDKYEMYFIRFFFFVMFDHNVKLIGRLDKNERSFYSDRLISEIKGDKFIFVDFLKYLNLRENFNQRLVFGTINTGRHTWSIFKLAKEAGFFQRRISGRENVYLDGVRAKPYISIVTIAKNVISGGRRRYFDDMVASVKKQSVGQGVVEHIVVDAASDDGTVEYLESLYESNEISFWISEPDTGIYNAMNKGAMIACGQYLLYLNSDDYLHKNAIEMLLYAIKKENAHYAFADAIKVNESDKKVGKHVGNINKVYFGAPYCHQTLLCERSVFDDVYFDERYKITMWSYAFDLHFSGFKGVYVPEALAYFRMGGISTNASYSHAFKAEQRKIKEELIVSRLPISYEEYEYLNHKFRRWSLEGFDLDYKCILKKLSESNDEFSVGFLKAYKSLIKGTSNNGVL